MSWIKAKNESPEFLSLVESLNRGETVGNIFNFGGTSRFKASKYQEHDESRRFAQKDFGVNLEFFPVQVEFDPDSKFKDSVRIRYKDRHIGWISKEDAVPLVTLLKNLPDTSSLAGVGKIWDYGRSKPGEYGKVLLEVKVFSEQQKTKTYKSPLKSLENTNKKSGKGKVQKDQAIEDLVKTRMDDLATGNWDRTKLTLGDSVCFSQFGNELRRTLEEEAVSLGFTVATSVTKKLTLLVIEGKSLVDSAKAKKAIEYRIPISDLDTYLSENRNK